MTKREAMIQALNLGGMNIEAMAQDNLGIGRPEEDKVKDALKELSEQLFKKMFRLQRTEDKKRGKKS